MSIEDAANDHDACPKKAAWYCRVCLILIYNPKVDLFKIVFDNCID